MRWPALLLGFFSHALRRVGSQEAAPPSLDTLPFEQLLQIVGYELQSEDKNPSARHMAFDEFQDIAEFDCVRRLVYLMNETITTSRHLQSYQRHVLGVSGLYQHVLRTVPQENTWVWLMTNAHRHLLDSVHAYWSKVVALALDQHQCLVTQVRDVVLDAVVAWKRLHAELLAMQWSGFAFGRYAAGAGSAGGAGPGEEAAREASNESLPGSFTAGNMWIASAWEWFEGYAQRLAGTLTGLEELGAQHEEGAIRLHHQDEHGSFVTYEFLRRKVFGQWAIDRGLLRGLIRHVWRPPHGSSDPVSVADFGAGGGHYSTWLNDTGLVQAYAFDGTHQAAELTDGAVQEVNLVKELNLWRNFSWVLCLEVGEHIPQQFASGLLRNLRRHAQDGLVMSWSDDWEGIGHVNCLSREDFVARVQDETGFLLDPAATEAVKASCEIEYIARTVAVFRAPT